MGVTNPHHRSKFLAAVAELLEGGGTQVYILAAQMNWRILKQEEKRKLPKSLLTEMIRMMIMREKLNLSCFRISKDCLPLPLILASHRYSLQLSTHQQDVEKILFEEWKKIHLSKSLGFSSVKKNEFPAVSSSIDPNSSLSLFDHESKISQVSEYCLHSNLSR